jgi:hypothetical protein
MAFGEEILSVEKMPDRTPKWEKLSISLDSDIEWRRRPPMEPGNAHFPRESGTGKHPG